MSATIGLPVEQARLSQPYNGVAQSFHWLIVLMLVAQYATKLILPFLLPEADHKALNAWHLSIGSTILLVMLLRLAWRLTHTPPPPPADLPAGLRVLSRATHWGFYAVLIGLPLGGWIAANAYGATVFLAGLVPLPALVGQDRAFAEQIGAVHGLFAWALLALIALHVTGALYHAVIKRDGVIRRMLPG